MSLHYRGNVDSGDRAYGLASHLRVLLGSTALSISSTGLPEAWHSRTLRVVQPWKSPLNAINPKLGGPGRPTLYTLKSDFWFGATRDVVLGSMIVSGCLSITCVQQVAMTSVTLQLWLRRDQVTVKADFVYPEPLCERPLLNYSNPLLIQYVQVGTPNSMVYKPDLIPLLSQLSVHTPFSVVLFDTLKSKAWLRRLLLHRGFATDYQGYS